MRSPSLLLLQVQADKMKVPKIDDEQAVATEGDESHYARGLARSEWAGFDFVPFIPIQPGSIVGVAGDWAHLRADLASCGAVVRSIETEPLGEGELHHLVNLDLAAGEVRSAALDASRAIRPEGWAIFGFPRVALAPGGVRRITAALSRAGFQTVQPYGAHPSVDEARYLVPIDGPGPAEMFWADIFTPSSFKAALGQRAIGCLVRLRLVDLLFGGMVVMAQRAA